jgi:hypothetical protein
MDRRTDGRKREVGALGVIFDEKVTWRLHR